MLLKGEQLAAHLERELRPLYVLYGDEPLLVIEAADAIRARARQQGYSEREVLTVLPHFDWNQLLAAGGNLSLFGDKKLIDLRIPTGKPGKEGGAALQDWCQQPVARQPAADHPAGTRLARRKGRLVHHAGQCRRRDQADGAATGRTAGLDRRPPAPPAAERRARSAEVHRRARRRQPARRPSGNPEARPALPGRRAVAGADPRRRAQRRPLRHRRPARGPARRRHRPPEPHARRPDA